MPPEDPKEDAVFGNQEDVLIVTRLVRDVASFINPLGGEVYYIFPSVRLSLHSYLCPGDVHRSC